MKTEREREISHIKFLQYTLSISTISQKYAKILCISMQMNEFCTFCSEFSSSGQSINANAAEVLIWYRSHDDMIKIHTHTIKENTFPSTEFTINFTLLMVWKICTTVETDSNGKLIRCKTKMLFKWNAIWCWSVPSHFGEVVNWQKRQFDFILCLFDDSLNIWLLCIFGTTGHLYACISWFFLVSLFYHRTSMQLKWTPYQNPKYKHVKQNHKLSHIPFYDACKQHFPLCFRSLNISGKVISKIAAIFK